MKTLNARCAGGLLAASLTLTGAVQAQSQWTDLGCALAGGAGAPVLSGSGDLTPGSPAAVDLTNANGSALSLAFLGLEQVAVPFKGGVLKPLPAFNLPLTQTSPTGTQSLPFTWPTGLPDGLPFYVQFAIQDGGAPNGVALSNALRGVSAGSQPLIDDISPLLIAEGGELTISGVNLSTDPLDVLTQLVLPGDVRVGYLTTTSSDGNTVTATVDHVMSGTSVAQIAVGNGEGSLYVPASLPPGLTLEGGSARLWRGLPEDIQTSGQFVTIGSGDPGPPPGCLEYPGVVNTLDWIEVEIPALVCEPGTTMSFFMWVYSSSGLYCDYFQATLTNTGAGDASDCAAALGALISGAFFSSFGKVIIPQVEVTGADALLKLPPPFGETWVVDSSSSVLTVCQPQTPGCETVSGGIDGGSGFVIVGLPASIPDDATVTWSFDGTTNIGGASYSLGNTLVLSGGLAPIDVADAVEVDLQAALIGAGSLASALAVPLGGGAAQLQVWPPLFDTWSSGQLVIEVCE